MPEASTPRKRRFARVGLGAELHAPDVTDAHERAVRPGLDDDALELIDLRQPAFGADAQR